ncbi:MAG: TonB-dependent receptor [Flavobacteriales bacterium]|nr:TonB-dependent receptor [Flavobacteriales bacterium]MCB9449513.1 TonB-dependent receptor [Flavobacteriales bacterium]
MRPLHTRLFWIVGIVACCLTSGIHAQQKPCRERIAGKVVSDGKPLSFVSVVIDSTQLGSTTGDDGSFSIEHLCKGKYHLIFSSIGYERLDTTVQTGGKPVVVTMKSGVVELGDVSVVAQKADVVSQQSVEVKSEQLAAKRGLSLGQTLGEVAGVTMIEKGNGVAKPVIHGLHSNRVLILNNGVRQEGQQWSMDFAPEIDPFVASKITVIEGAASVKYGSDAMGGVILVDAPPLRYMPGIEGELNLVGFTNNKEGVASAQIGGYFPKLKHFSWRLQGTLVRAGTARAPDYLLSNTGFKENNFSYAAGYKREHWEASVFYSQYNAEIGVYRGSHIHTLRDLVNTFEGNIPDTAKFSYDLFRPKQAAAHELFKVNTVFHPGEGKTNWSLTWSRQFNRREEYDVYHGYDILDESLAPQLSYKITTNLVSLSWQRTHTKPLHTEAGIDLGFLRNTITNAFYLPKHDDMTFGVYGIERYQKGVWMLETGLRWDYESNKIRPRMENDTLPEQLEYNNYAFSVGASRLLNEYLTWKLNAGTAYRPPSVAELFSNGINHGEASFIKGNSRLKSETMFSLTSGATFDRKWAHVYGSAFFKSFHDYIFLAPQRSPTLTIRGIFPTLAYEQAEVRMHGADIRGTFDIWKYFEVGGQYSVVRGFNKSIDDYLALMPPDQGGYHLGMHWKRKDEKLSAHLKWKVMFVERQTRVPENSEPVEAPGPYALTSIETGVDYKVGGQVLSAGIEVTNLFDVRYRSYLNRLRYYSDEVGRNVAIRLKLPFEMLTGKRKHPQAS